MPASPRKAPHRCPHCAFVQHEPVHLISTFCRACGRHYDVSGASRADAHPEKPRGGWVDRTVQRVIARPPRAVLCHHCHQTHEVSGYAKSTFCPGCGTSIEFENLTFSTNVSRPVDTRGRLRIEPGGYLNSGLIICGEALIEGRVSGKLSCEGTVHLACSARLSCHISAKSIVVDKAARVEVGFPMRSQGVTVYGHLFGPLECEGTVYIHRHGVFEGNLRARAVIVEKGGLLRAESVIQPRETPRKKDSPSEKARVFRPAEKPESDGLLPAFISLA